MNSYTCIPTKKSLQSTVAESQPRRLRLPCCAPLSASTTKKELKSRTAVPKGVTSGISKIGLQVVICPCSMHCDTSCGSGPTRLLPL